MLVRYYAAAMEAAGLEQEDLPLAAGATVGDVQKLLVASHPPLAAILPQCSLLADGGAVHSPSDDLTGVTSLDILPPFAGG